MGARATALAATLPVIVLVAAPLPARLPCEQRGVDGDDAPTG